MDKFTGIARRARAVAPIAAFAFVASALVVPSVERATAAQAEDASATNVTVADDFTSARVDAKAQGHRVEVLSERTETSQTFVSAKGVVTREIAAAPVRVRDSSSDGWGAIDLKLSKQTDGSYAPAAVPGEVRLNGGEDAQAKGVLVSLSSGKRSVSLDWAGALPVPTIDGATATYKDVKPGMDLKVEVTRTGIEQYFVLKDRPAAGEEPTLALPIAADGVVVADGRTDRGQTIETKSGDAVGAISPALTWDATTEHGVHTQTDVSDSEVKTVDGKRSLVITPDAEFLQSPDTTYPVTIDPSVTLIGSSISDVYLKSTAPDGNVGGTQLLVGTNDSGATKYRSLVTVTTGAAMKGATVQSASLGLWENSSASCTATPVTAYGFATRHYAVNQTWNNQPADINNPTSVTTAKGYSSSCAAGWVNFDVAQQLQASLNAPWDVMTIELRADETSNGGFKSFDSSDGAHVPTLNVTYDLPPAKPQIPAVSAGTTGATKVYTSSLSPSFTATSADPETENVKYTYNVYNSASPQDATTLVGTCTTGFVPSGSSASCTPGVTLADGTSYWARATATDATGVSSKPSNSLYFATAAAKPTAPTISCPSPYADGYWASSAPTSAVACTVSVIGNYKGLGPKQITVTLDGTNSTVTPVAASGTTTASIPVPKSAGVHTITAYTVSGAQLSSATMTYRFGYGSPGIATPNSGIKTLGPVKISAYAPFKGSAARVSANLQWRVSGASSASQGWNTVSTTDVTPSASNVSPSLTTTWNSATATTDASVTPAIPINPRLTTRLDVRVCFVYDGGTPTCTSDEGAPTTILRIPSAFGDGFPVAEAGEGSVALSTGEFSEVVTDADLPTNLGSLSIRRTHSTFTAGAESTAASGVFGPGWTADFAVDNTGAANLIVDDQTASSGALNFVDTAGDVLAYATPNGQKASSPTGTYIPVDSDTSKENNTVAISGAASSKTLTLTDLNGTVTTWRASGGEANATWVPVSVAMAGQQGSISYSSDNLGRITRVLAPVPDGVSCPAVGTLPAGCSWLRLAYASSTTATSSSAGDYAGRLKSVYFNSYDPSTSSMGEAKVAGYTYDGNGRLAVVTDPRSGLAKSYEYSTYGAFTALTQQSATGYAAYKYLYDVSDGSARLREVVRGAPVAGGSDVTVSSFVYDASPGADGPDLSSGQILKWGQTTNPVTASAVFGADHPVRGVPAGEDWPYAELHYTNSAGYEVNTATYGAGQWLVTAKNYKSDGRIDTVLQPTALAGALEAARLGVVFEARANASVTRYLPAVTRSGGGGSLVAEESVVQDTWSAPLTAVLRDGTTEQVRIHTHYTYDEGAPANNVNAATGGPFLLPTTVTVGVAGVSDTSTDPVAILPSDLETTGETKYGYDPVDGASSTGATSGWVLGKATSTTTVMPAAADIVRKVRFDSRGATIASYEPGSSGSDAGTTLTIRYTSGQNAQDDQCGNHPEWANLVCWSGPAAQPETGMDISDSRTVYNRWLAPTVVTETSGSGSGRSTRTTTYSYYTDGREKARAVAVSGLSGSTPIPTSKVVYDAISLAPTGTQTLDSSGSVIATNNASRDLWGRTTKYYSNSSDNTNYTYVAAGVSGAGQLASVANSKGVATYGYDGTDATGNIERRGMVTSLAISGVGNFTGAYDRDGNLTTETMPGGISRTTTFDSQGRLTGLRYLGGVAAGGGSVTASTWFAFGRSYDSAGRVAADWSPSGASTQPGGYTRGYGYDRNGRLIQADDSTRTDGAGASCTTRTYSYDVRGNRLNQSSGTSGDCAATASATASWSYDNYSRQLSGSAGGTYVQDAFGRQTSIPASDAGNGGQSLELTYYDDDAVQSLTRGTSSVAFTRDPDGRRVAVTDSSGQTSVNHYSGDSDSPQWVTQSVGSVVATSRYVTGLDGQVVATTRTSGSSTVSLLQLMDLTGSDFASVAIPSSGNALSVSGTADFDEFGQVINSSVDTGLSKYGWKARAQRQVTTGELQLMGERVYNPRTGRFTSQDPVPGANENAYNYPNDPVNLEDLTGEMPRPPEAGGPGGGGRGSGGSRASGSGKKGSSGDTAATRRGKGAHKAYHYPPGAEREVTIKGAGRADAVDFQRRIVYELKPNNARAYREGQRQVQRYVDALNKQFRGKRFQGVVLTY
jgi:RHS repeat-associated protein